MKKKKLSILRPISNCCLKKFLDLDSIAKYGSLFIISFMILLQIFNITIGYNTRMSLFSMFINMFFLIAVLNKLEMIKVSFFEERQDKILKFIIFVFILNFFAYLVSTVQLHNYVFAPMSFLGAYFVFILLKTK